MDEFYEIGSLEDFHDGDTVELVEEPYTQRDVRVHLQRLKDLLLTDAVHQAVVPGGEGLSLSFLAAIALTNPEGIPAFYYVMVSMNLLCAIHVLIADRTYWVFFVVKEF